MPVRLKWSLYLTPCYKCFPSVFLVLYGLQYCIDSPSFIWLLFNPAREPGLPMLLVVALVSHSSSTATVSSTVSTSVHTTFSSMVSSSVSNNVLVVLLLLFLAPKHFSIFPSPQLTTYLQRAHTYPSLTQTTYIEERSTGSLAMSGSLLARLLILKFFKGHCMDLKG